MADASPQARQHAKWDALTATAHPVASAQAPAVPAVAQLAVIDGAIDTYKNVEAIWKDATTNAQRFDHELSDKDTIKEKLGPTIKNNAMVKAKKAYSTIAGEGFEPRSWGVDSATLVRMPGGSDGADVESRMVKGDEDGSTLLSKTDVKTSVGKETVITNLVDTFFKKNAGICVLWLRSGLTITEVNAYLIGKFRTVGTKKYTVKSFEVTDGSVDDGGAAIRYTFEEKDTATDATETKTGLARVDEEPL